MILKNTILDDVVKNYFAVVMFFFCLETNAQLTDNFSDGDLTNNPSWSGNTNSFIVNPSFQLQLHEAAAGTSYLSTPSQMDPSDTMVWRIIVRQSFAPSGSNFGRIYLTSDQTDLTGALHGYYLQFGETGANDAIELFKQNGLTSTSVCRGQNGLIAASFNVNVMVVRSAAGKWQISADHTGGNNFVLDASGADATFISSAFFGLVCTYTSSNASKFFYDNIYAGPLNKDTAPPSIISVDASSSTVLSVHYSEEIDIATAQDPLNYNVSNGIGNPKTSILQPDKKTITLTFQKQFSNGVENVITISRVADLAHNAIALTQIPFTFFQPFGTKKRDIIFTEVFPDPSGAIGLPAAEYIEIYNRSSNAIDLSEWKLNDGRAPAILASAILLPNAYLILTSTTNLPQFAHFQNTIGVNGFPSLNNDGDALVLRNKEGLLIDSINFSLSWYHSTDKQEGGWSLELIDLTNACSNDNNWTSSEDPSGGTPGKENSVNASKPDVTGPSLLHLDIRQATLISISFSEPLDSSSITRGQFLLTPLNAVTGVRFSDRGLRTVDLQLQADLDSGVLYSLSIDGVADCSGNPLPDQEMLQTFSLPQHADSLNILINEILFNPRPSGVDFVEVYNNSTKYIDLKNWKLANFENRILKNVMTISNDDLTAAPHSYIAFTTDSVSLKNNYPAGVSQNFFITGLPSLPDDSGTIALVTNAGRVIDFFLYDASYHTKLLKDVEGVSLERISFSAGNSSQNWTSASSQSGFATPGYLNSCAKTDTLFTNGKVSVEPVIISPGSGHQEFARINYKFDAGGYVGNIKIMDQQGRMIKVIGNNETLGVEGFFRWDGDRDDGTKARIGYYVVWFEIFDISGYSATFRKRVIIAPG